MTPLTTTPRGRLEEGHGGKDRLCQVFCINTRKGYDSIGVEYERFRGFHHEKRYRVSCK